MKFRSFFKSFQISHLFVFEDLLKYTPALPFNFFAVLLFNGPSLGMNMAEDQVELGVAAALVRPEHDGVRGLVCQLTQVEVLGAGEQLDITATAVEPVLESHLVLKDQLLLLPEGEGSLQLGRHSAENIL